MQRSSASRTSGVCIRKATLAGTEYTLSRPDKVRKAADEEAVVISRRLDILPALARACEEIPETSRREWRRDYISVMVTGIASPEEWANYFRSPWQMAFRFWNALDEKDRGNRSLLDGVEWAYDTITAQDVTEDEYESLKLAIRMVSQQDSLGNSSGLAEVASPPMADHSMEAGQQSTPTTSTKD